MRYGVKVRFLKRPFGNRLWRGWHVRRGAYVGDYAHLPRLISEWVHAGDSFADIGCMWGVNGRYAFVAEDAGAQVCKGVDVFGPTPEFEAAKHERGSAVEFILGDATHPDTIAAVGTVDVVFCAGVLYHHPSPFDLLTALRRMCGRHLILRTSTIPEVSGAENAAIYFPMLSARARNLWNLRSLGVERQVGISEPFDPGEGYGNWFWGLSTSCLISLVETAGFEVLVQFTEPFAQTLICKVTDVPFEHRLPGDSEAARALGTTISASGVAHPA
ncbi:hypothetical protein BH23ACT3_BH23ACT3_09360 [soil metagenome]